MLRDNPADRWMAVLNSYRLFASSVNGAWVTPMIEIVNKLSETEYATILYPTTSHFDLMVAKVPRIEVDTPYVGIEFDHRRKEYRCTLEEGIVRKTRKTVTCSSENVPIIFSELVKELLSQFP